MSNEATDTRGADGDSVGNRPSKDSGTLGGLVGEIVADLASPKFTVVLIVLSIAIVLFGTLAQVYMDIWLVVAEYFRAWIAWIELKVLFPPSFFPWAARTDWDALPLKSFPFPGGVTIGLALVINLSAAHAARFKPKARGGRLTGGLFVLFAGIVATWLVIETGQNRQGVQGQHLLQWSTLSVLLQVGLAGLWLTCLSALVYVLRTTRRARSIELAILGSLTVVLGLLLGWLVFRGSSEALNESSLRILYQLIQAEIAALVLLVACVLLFYRRASLVLLHAGLGLLMFGEIFVAYFAEEQQMTLAEGQTVSHTRDIRSVELAVTTQQQGGPDKVVAIPFVTNGKTTRYAAGGALTLEDMPFDLEVLRYFKNSTVRAVRNDETNTATFGLGLRYVAEEATPRSGLGRGQVDYASAYVRVIRKQDREDLGTFLVSQHLSNLPAGFNTQTVDNKTYGLELRFKHLYQPYSLTLLDVRKDDYVGTTMPRNYSSQVRLVDPSRNVDFETKIWMNNPLRYAGQTFYQSGYNADRGGKETSTLQIVANTGWMIPYVSCMIVATGMLGHFFLILIRFLGGLPSQAVRESGAGDSHAAGTDKSTGPSQAVPSDRPSRVFAGRWLVPLATVLLAAAYIANSAMPPRVPDTQMQLEEFGSLPLMYQGRVKPFDTLARSSLRVLSDRETFKDAAEEKHAAIVWLLDLIARPKAADEHRVFRIIDPDTREVLGLERRRGYRYSWAELRRATMEFERQVTLALQQASLDRTRQQRKLLQLRQRVDRYRLLVDAFRPLPFPTFPQPGETAENREDAVKRVATIKRLLNAIPSTNQGLAARQPPLAVPLASSTPPWETYATAKNVAYKEQYLHQKEPPASVTQLAAIFQAYADEDPRAFNSAVAQYKTLLANDPPAGLNLRMTAFEARFNRSAPFYRAIPLYGVALLLTVFAWLAGAGSPRLSTMMRSSAFWLILLAFVVHTLALAARVAISGRPPVTNLYSSAVFVGWGCVAFGLLLECVYRLGIGNLVSAIAGIGTLIVAHFLAGDGDTIRVLQAVLDTQFWLTVHVLTITLGYSATFLAGLLGLLLTAYLLLRGVMTRIVSWRLARRGRRKRDRGSDQSLLRPEMDVVKILGTMIYGTVCFAVFFSFVGTVLGGLWADDSWGRFWGWDPKENGALIVVLWNALIVHARWARLVKARGLALLAIGGNIVTGWSWFGVNELGVGLHSYGFTEGAARALWIFWISQLIVIGLGLLPVLSERIRRGTGSPQTAATS